MISRYELGVTHVSLSLLERISNILNVNINYFFETPVSHSTSSTSQYKSAFVFDLDDTLIDVRQFCGETIARTIASVEPSVDFQLVIQMHDSIKGLVIEDLYRYILDKLNIKADIADLLKKDRVIQDENISKMKMFDGVIEILEFLKVNNKKIYMCTNRTKPLMDKILKVNGKEKYFNEVISCADAGYKKPNPYCLIDLISRSKIPKEQFMYFGDSEVDSDFAKNANIEHIILDQYLNDKNLFKKLVNLFLEKQLNGS